MAGDGIAGLNITRVIGESLRAYRRFSPMAGKSRVTMRASSATTVPNPSSLSVSLIQR
jgi:hypothetical protein